MPLTNKYLKYSPEITLEIFTLVWNKLIELGLKSKYNNNLFSEFNSFINKHNYLIIEDGIFNTYLKSCIYDNKETTVQEILGYDPFMKKEVIPEYVELLEGFDNTCTGKIFNTNQPIPQISGWSKQWTWESIFKNNIQRPYFKPSTKEAFNAQNKPIEKWNVGSYFVIEKDRLYNISSSKRGDICVIKKDKTFNFINKKDQIDWSFDFREGSRWFATKSEAEEFAKTLVESVKEEVKQLLKQAVHCETQEQWDFVTEKLGYKWNAAAWTDYGNNTCVNLEYKGLGTADVAYIDYQILSFQEWCDLNGYKMEKEVKFEVGKWYKAYYAGKIYFLKYKNTISRNGYNQINYSEFINNGVYKINDSISNTDLENSFKVLDDLEEIQQYLRDDHPDKIKVDRKFKVGEWVCFLGTDKSLVTKVWNIGKICKIDSIVGDSLKFKEEDNIVSSNRNDQFRHATPEEINNYLVSIGQIPAGEPLNTGIEPNKDGAFKYSIYSGTTHVGKTSTISRPLKMTLSIDDEELPMVNIIKTNTIKQLLNND